ncbi:MAG: CDP-alcohol phosphatidyltransferase family protein [Balneolales bacterium]
MKRVPNILSVFRMLLAPLFVFLFLQDAFWWAALSIPVFILAALTDYLDGFYARRYKVSSSLGIFLDPLADKTLTIAGFICIPFIDPLQFPWWIIVIIILRDIFVTLLRIWSDANGKTMITRYSAKIKTFVQMSFLYIVLLTGVLIKAGGVAGQASRSLLETGVLGWLFIIVMLITVYTALEYLFLNRKLFISDSKNA